MPLIGPYKKIVCPHCGERHDPGDYPDSWREGGRAKFHCANCEASFTIIVEFDPVFYVEIK